MSDKNLISARYTQSKTIIWLTIFSIAMGYMESAVVIYLRKIYYPDGFQFPIGSFGTSIGIVELFREVATIIMLMGIGILSAKSTSMRFAYFIFCFAIWDLFYYIFLWICIGWPESLFTWDILFLIPLPWIGPVITPCIVSITMLLLAFSIIHFHNSGIDSKLKVKETSLFSIGCFVIILSFLGDRDIKDYIPVDFNWTLFSIGEAIFLYGIILFITRLNKSSQKNLKIY